MNLSSGKGSYATGDFRSRMQMLVNEAGNAEALARKVGLSGKMIGNYLRGSQPGRDKIEKMAAVMGVRVGWLATGEGPMRETEAGWGSVREEGPTCGTVTGAPNGDFVFVPMMQGKISAGGGLVPDNRPEMAVAFRREWMERRGDPRHMSAIRVEGDSMVPTLQPNDIILVNHNVNTVAVNGGIYAIVLNDQIAVKRISVVFPDNRLRIISDNKAYEEYTADPAQIIINGKVIWYGRDLER